MARDSDTKTTMTIKRKSPLRQMALTIGANDNGKGAGVRSFTPFYNPAVAVRMFNAYKGLPSAGNSNSPNVGKYLKK